MAARSARAPVSGSPAARMRLWKPSISIATPPPKSSRSVRVTAAASSMALLTSTPPRATRVAARRSPGSGSQSGFLTFRAEPMKTSSSTASKRERPLSR